MYLTTENASADGRLPEEALRELRGLGAWLKINGEAIYGTRPMEVAQVRNVRYTRKGDSIYAIIPLEKGERLTDKVLIPIDREICEVVCLGYERSLCFERTDVGILAVLPEEVTRQEHYALSFRLI